MKQFFKKFWFNFKANQKVRCYNCRQIFKNKHLVFHTCSDLPYCLGCWESSTFALMEQGLLQNGKDVVCRRHWFEPILEGTNGEGVFRPRKDYENEM